MAHENIAIVSGIGCSSRLPYYMETYGMHTIHGRASAIASGLKSANKNLQVWQITGDGDCLAIGGNHFIHACRKNIDITYIVHNNQVFGLTKGQASPVSELGMVTGTTPDGSYYERFNPLAVAISLNAGFVARSYAGNREHLSRMIKAAIQHKGFSIIDVLQPCVTFNKINTYQWFRDRVYDLDAEEGYDPTDRQAAWERSWEWGERIPIGIFYRVTRPSLHERFSFMREGPLIKRDNSQGRLKEIIDELVISP